LGIWASLKPSKGLQKQALDRKSRKKLLKGVLKKMREAVLQDLTRIDTLTLNVSQKLHL